MTSAAKRPHALPPVVKIHDAKVMLRLEAADRFVP
jgi:hypothetical protein